MKRSLIKVHRIHTPLKVLWKILKVAQQKNLCVEFVKVVSPEELLLEIIYEKKDRKILLKLIELVNDYIMWEEEKQNGLERKEDTHGNW